MTKREQGVLVRGASTSKSTERQGVFKGPVGSIAGEQRECKEW